MNSTPLILPLTFLPQNSVREDHLPSLDARALTFRACSDTSASCLVSWGEVGLPDQTSSSLSGPESVTGTAVGCEDGTVYIFRCIHGDHVQSRVSLDLPDITSSSRPSSPPHQRRSGRSVSRSSTPTSLTSNFSPFQISPRAQVVSGISAEQAQAPRNYVDYEDEPDKLKDMLKGGVRDTSVTDRLIPSFERGFAFEKTSPPTTALPSPSIRTVQRPDTRALLSATQSPALTSKSGSIPPSPSLPPSPSPQSHVFSLVHHVFLPGFGHDNAVTAMKSLRRGGQIFCLQRQGGITIVSAEDGSCLLCTHAGKSELLPPPGAKGSELPECAWRWTRLELLESAESTLIMACAESDESVLPQIALDSFSESDQQQSCRVVILTLQQSRKPDSEDVVLEKIGDWCVEGGTSAVGLFSSDDGSLRFITVNQEQRLAVQTVQISSSSHALGDEVVLQGPEPMNLVGIPLNPFRRLPSIKAKTNSVIQNRFPGRVELHEFANWEAVTFPSGLKGLRAFPHGQEVRLGVWSDHELVVYDSISGHLSKLFVQPYHGIQDLQWFNKNAFSVIFSDKVDSYRISLLDANGDEVTNTTSSGILHPRALGSIQHPNVQALHLVSPSQVISTSVNSQGRRLLELCKQATYLERTTLWKASQLPKLGAPADKRVTCSLPLELTLVILGFSDGTLGRSSLSHLIHSDATAQPMESSDVPLSGFITSLHRVYSSRGRGPVLVGGADDGSVAIWSFASLELLARWTIFVAPLADVAQFYQDKGEPFWDCILCISRDGTIAVIAPNDRQFLYLIPGAQAPLVRLCTRGNNLLLIYANDRARLWDAKTQEFRRSLILDKAEELLSQEVWTDINVGSREKDSLYEELAPLAPTAVCADAAATILLDLEVLFTRAISTDKAPSNVESGPENISVTIDDLRSIIATLLTPGLNADIDLICRERLGIGLTAARAGLYGNQSTSLILHDGPRGPWCISPEVSATRALSLVSGLRVLSHFEGVADDVNTVIAFYTISLPHVIGSSYRPPSLSFLARWWFESSAEIRSAARTLFDAGIASMSMEETITLVEHWQHQLPCLQPNAERTSSTVAMALFLCGYIAADRFNLLSTSSLNDISKSIVMYLHDEDTPYKLLAVDLCSRGFNIWQQYVDAMEMLRCLFSLATNSRKDNASTQNVGPQARQAVLQIVTHNTALFMTTLSLDILHPRSMDHRKSIMQLIAFLIRKRPLIIYPNLPRLIEAVVRSLDPNFTADREAVLDTATEILGHVVKTFPTVDFHMSTQRLAVGTSEGAIIMYDLKTATRLYVLECHKKRPAACSFSPDGRRLVTVSLEEGLVLVWKVGSSFTSFFLPGAPPRQGHGGSEPYKSLSFAAGDEAHMSIEDTLTEVRFEWVAERSVRLKIRDLTLTFST